STPSSPAPTSAPPSASTSRCGRKTAGSAAGRARQPAMDTAVAEHIRRVNEDGYTIVEDAIEPDLVDGLSEDLARLEQELGIEPARNSFEGTKTLRVYN